MSDSPAGWHPDPRGRHEHRYWDGTQWTDHVADAGVMATDPVAEVTPVAAPIGPSMVNLPAISPGALSGSSPAPAEPAATTPEPAAGSGAGPLWAGDEPAAEPQPESQPQPGPEPEPEPEPAAEPQPTAVQEEPPVGAGTGADRGPVAGGERSPDLAALLSVVAPGSGHIYLGRMTGIAYGLLGATLLAVVLSYFSFLLFIVGLLIWAGAAAYALIDLRGGLAGLREARLTTHLVGWILVAGGAAMIVGLLLPWYHVSVHVSSSVAGVDASQSQNFSGFKVLSVIDIIVLVVGLASVVAGLAALGKGPISSDELPPAMPAIIAGAALLVAVLTFFRLFVDPVPSFGSLGSAGTVDVSVGRGPGALLTAAAAIAVLVASASAVTASRHSPSVATA